jgi:hypothetical protein
VILKLHHVCVTCQRRKLEILYSPEVRIRISGSEKEKNREKDSKRERGIERERFSVQFTAAA